MGTCWALLIAVAGVIGPEGPTALVLIGDDDQVTRLSPDDLAAMPRQAVEVIGDDDEPVSYEGVPLIEVLARGGFPTGETLRGPGMTCGLLVEAADRYRVLFSLAELDPAYTDRVVLLADRRDGRPIVPPEGPLRLIVPGDRRHARWVRMVLTLTLHTADAPPPFETSP